MNITEVEYTDEEYEDYLNEVLPDVTIGSLVYSPGHALRRVDPIAFRCGQADMPIRYQCGECQTIYEDDEDAAEACCNDS